MQVTVRKVAGPALEPVSISEARIMLRQDVPGFYADNSQDGYLRQCISAARRAVELKIDKVIGAQTFVASLDYFPASSGTTSYTVYSSTPRLYWPVVTIPTRPVRSIEGIFYRDTNGDLIEVDAATYGLAVDGSSQIVLLDGASWPDVVAAPGAVRIEFTAGMSYPGETDVGVEYVEEDVLAAIRLLIGHFWTNRSAVVSSADATVELPLGVDALLWPNKAGLGM